MKQFSHCYFEISFTLFEIFKMENEIQQKETNFTCEILIIKENLYF